jgi:hypothetical protein
VWKKYRRDEQAAVDNMAHVHGMLGHAVTQLEHCFTSLKVACSIPDVVTGIFH